MTDFQGLFFMILKKGKRFGFGILACLWYGVLNLMLEIWNLFVIWYLEFVI